MKTGRRFSWILAGLLLSGAAHAADPDPQKRGEALLKEGLAATKRGDYQHARAAFLQASTLIPRGAVWRNLGLAEMRLGRPVEALKHYRLAASSADLDAEKRSVLQQNILDAYALTGHIEVLANDGAAVTVDGSPVEDAAEERIDVMPGKHVIEASTGAGASRMARAEIDAAPNKMVTLDLRVVEEAPAPTPAAPAAGSAQGSGPLAAGGSGRSSVASSGLGAGSRPDAASRPGMSGGSVRPERPVGYDDVPPVTTGPAFWSTRRSLGAVLGGAGIVSLGAAAFFVTQVEGDKSRASTIRSGVSPSACVGSSPASSCAALENAYSSQRSDATWTLGFLGVGSVALVTGAALVFWPSPASSRPTVGPLIVPQGAGLSVAGAL